MKIFSCRQKGCGPRSGRAAIVPFALALALFSVYSCRHAVNYDVLDAEAASAVSEQGFEVSARFLSAPGEIMDIFHAFLPDSNVVPVKVSVRNNFVLPLRMHSTNSLGLGEEYRGFTLVIDGEEFLPVHPIDVLRRISGTDKLKKYKRPGSVAIFGSAVFPPVGGYYVYREVKAGRYYKPLFENSVYPATESGLYGPVELEPGQEASGLLYFIVPPGSNPYAGAADLVRAADSVGAAEAPAVERTPGIDLVVRPSLTEAAFDEWESLAVKDSLPVHQPVFTRGNGSTGASSTETIVVRGRSDRSVRYGTTLIGGMSRYIFAMSHPPGDSRKHGLVFAHAEDLLDGGAAAFQEVALLSSSKPVIADASEYMDLAACAVNVKRKSMVFLVGAGGAPELIGTRKFPRAIRRVFQNGDGIIVLTSDKYLHFVSYDGMKLKRSVKLEHGIEDAVHLGDRLYIFYRAGIAVFGTTDRDLLQEIDRRPLPKAKRVVISPFRDRILIMNRGKRGEGDTLVVFAPDPFRETARAAFPGRVAHVSAGAGIVVQLEEGTVLIFGMGNDGTLFRKGDAFLSMHVKTSVLMGNSVVALSDDGKMAHGPLKGSLPVTLEQLVTRLRLGPPPEFHGP